MSIVEGAAFLLDRNSLEADLKCSGQNSWLSMTKVIFLGWWGKVGLYGHDAFSIIMIRKIVI